MARETRRPSGGAASLSAWFAPTYNTYIIVQYSVHVHVPIFRYCRPKPTSLLLFSGCFVLCIYHAPFR